jgi:hypothetical protein
MLVLYLNSCRIVFNSVRKISFFPVSEASIVIEVRLARLKVYSHRETLDCLVEIPLTVQTYALVIICESVLRIDLNSASVISNGLIEFAYFVIGESPIEERLEVIRYGLNSLGVEFYCRLVISLFASCVPLGVTHLGMLLPLLIVWVILINILCSCLR